jgi:hypothetical protein
MALSTSEVESLRFHLGFGNISVDAYPYTADGFQALFEQVIAPNLTGSTETTATTAITAGTSATVTPASMTGIVPYAKLVVDVGDDVELVVVRTVTATTFSAKFTKAHPAAGYPIALMGGHARLRMLLNQADVAWQAMQDASIGATAGLKQVDKGDVEWFPSFQVLKDRTKHYHSIIDQIGMLVRVTPLHTGAGSQTISIY